MALNATTISAAAFSTWSADSRNAKSPGAELTATQRDDAIKAIFDAVVAELVTAIKATDVTGTCPSGGGPLTAGKVL